MPEYRRAIVPGGTFFLTVVTNFRRPLFASQPARSLLRIALEKTRSERPFHIDAIVLLPDHWHCIWTLPDSDTDFSTRMRLIKGRFTRAYLAAGGKESARSASREHQGERSVWHRRFWEHTIRDETDFEHICDYIHYNPVKHGNAAWAHSSFHRFVRDKRYDGSWQCSCDGRSPDVPCLEDMASVAGE